MLCAVRCLLFVSRSLCVVGYWSLVAVRCWLVLGYRVWFVVCCLMYVVCSLLCVLCALFCVACCVVRVLVSDGCPCSSCAARC